MLEPLVSIVIPCFNHGRFLREALASVGSPAVPTEIIVIDDGSTDETADVIATFETTNAFKSIRQQNAGIAAARNRGLRESRGRFVLFLDADDRLAPGAVDIAAAALNAHPECAFTFGRIQFIDIDGSALPTPEQRRIVRDHYRELLRRNYISVSAMVLFRRDALERIGGFNDDVSAASDYEVYLHIARHHPVHDHGQLVAQFRRHDRPASFDAARLLRDTLAVIRSQRPFLEGDEASLVAYEDGWRSWQQFYGEQLAGEVRSALREHRWAAALTRMMTLGRYYPRGLWQQARRPALAPMRVARRA